MSLHAVSPRHHFCELSCTFIVGFCGSFPSFLLPGNILSFSSAPSLSQGLLFIALFRTALYISRFVLFSVMSLRLSRAIYMRGFFCFFGHFLSWWMHFICFVLFFLFFSPISSWRCYSLLECAKDECGVGGGWEGLQAGAGGGLECPPTPRAGVLLVLGPPSITYLVALCLVPIATPSSLLHPRPLQRSPLPGAQVTCRQHAKSAHQSVETKNWQHPMLGVGADCLSTQSDKGRNVYNLFGEIHQNWKHALTSNTPILIGMYTADLSVIGQQATCAEIRYTVACSCKTQNYQNVYHEWKN